MAPAQQPARSWKFIGLIAAMTLALAASAHGQGVNRSDSRALNDALDQHVSTPRAQGRPPVVDLRSKLPRVGRQTMNDCAAWAFGYAARSYLEAIDQDWQPDLPERIFSPTFIYNQVNDGKDEGSNPLKVLELLRTTGAATMQTQPYLPNNYQHKPTESAMAEAAEFQISGYSMASDGEAIREALAAGDIVVIGVRTNPVFNSGRYDIYTTQHHTDGIKQRRPNQPHGYHAMVICGYNDHRRAFLFMNSWGTDWGATGFVWVSYDVADTFNSTDDPTERLMDFAVVMHDRREPIQRVNGKYQAVRLEELKVRHRFRCTGLDDAGIPIYDITLELAGPTELLDRVESVRWAYTDQGHEQHFTGKTNRQENHAAIITTRDRQLPLHGAVTLRGQQDVTFDAKLNLPAAMPHAPTIRRIDAYSQHALYSTTKALFRWSLVPEMNELDWASLSSIEWSIATGVDAGYHRFLRSDLAPAPGNTTFTFKPDFIGQPLQEVPSLAYPSSISNVPPTGTVTFRYRDGSTYRLDLPADAFPTAPTSNEWVRLSHVARPIGTYAGEEWYYFEVRAQYPEAWNAIWGSGFFQTEGLTHDVFAGAEAGRRTRGLEPSTIVYDGYTQYAFGVNARITMHNGPAPGRFDAPRPWTTAEKLLQGDHGRSSGISMRTHVVDPVPAEPSIRYADEYLGQDDAGQPMWAFAPWFTDLRYGYLHDMLDASEWLYDTDRIKTHQVQDMGTGFFTTYLHADGPIDVTFPTTIYGAMDSDGNRSEENIELTATLKPHAPATTGLTLQALDHLPRELAQLEQAPPAPMMQVNLIGSRHERQAVRSLDYLLPIPGASTHSVHIDADAMEDAPADFTNLRMPLPEPGQPVRAIATLVDGGITLLETKPAGYVPYADIPELTLSAISRYFGQSNGNPLWLCTITVNGHINVRDRIASVRFTLTTEAGQSVEPTPTNDPRTVTIVTAVPLRVEADIELTDDDQPRRHLSTIALAPAHRAPADDTPRLQASLVYTQQTYMNPNAMNIWEDYEDPVEHYVITLRAPEQFLQQVKAIEYMARDDREYDEEYESLPTPVRVERTPGDRHGAFTLPVEVSYFDASITATLHMADGSTRELEPLKILVDDTDRWEQQKANEYQLIRYPFGPHAAFDGKQSDLTIVQRVPWRDVPTRFAQATYELSMADEDEFAIVDTFTWPNAPAVAITTGSVAVTRAAEQRWDDTELVESALEAEKFVEGQPLARPATNALRVEPVEVNGEAWFRIVPDFDLVRLAPANEIWYELETPAGQRNVYPVAIEGLAPQRFSVLVKGPLPTRITANLRSFIGDTQALATWQAGE